MIYILFFAIALIGLCCTFSIVFAKVKKDRYTDQFENKSISFKRNILNFYWNLNGILGVCGYIYLLFASFGSSILDGVIYFLMCGLSCIAIFFIPEKLKLALAMLAPFSIYSLLCLI